MYDQSNPDSNLVDLVRASRPGYNWLTSRAIPWCLLPTPPPSLSHPLSVIYTFNLLEAEEEEEEAGESPGRKVGPLGRFNGFVRIRPPFSISHSIRIIKVAAYVPLLQPPLALLPPSHARLIARYLRDNWARLGEKSFRADSARSLSVSLSFSLQKL